MKMRNDSPFAALSEVERIMVSDAARVSTLEQLALHIEKFHPGLEFSLAALKRFVRRLREEELREDVEESEETIEGLAKSGGNGRARDGVLEAMRRKMYARALEEDNSATAMMVFKMMKEEQEKDRTLALQERRMALEEERAKQEWRRQELEDARSALKLLPQLSEILMGTDGTAEERLAQARQCFSSGGGKLLMTKGSEKVSD